MWHAGLLLGASTAYYQHSVSTPKVFARTPWNLSLYYVTEWYLFIYMYTYIHIYILCIVYIDKFIRTHIYIYMLHKYIYIHMYFPLIPISSTLPSASVRDAELKFLGYIFLIKRSCICYPLILYCRDLFPLQQFPMLIKLSNYFQNPSCV